MLNIFCIEWRNFISYSENRIFSYFFKSPFKASIPEDTAEFEEEFPELLDVDTIFQPMHKPS